MKDIRIGQLEITKWKYANPDMEQFIWFEYLNSHCGCKLLTVLNILFVYYAKKCEDNFCEDNLSD